MNHVCGIDIAKGEVAATILSDNLETRKFGVKLDDLFELKNGSKKTTAPKP
jgi:hypothetical protein